MSWRSRLRLRPPVLGICVGMQLLYESSEESPGIAGLGILPGEVRWIPPGVKRPQMQWNVLRCREPEHRLLAGLDGAWLYFVHSLSAGLDENVIATTDYGTELAAASARDNVMATQFHPEKSAGAGRRLLQNFLEVL